MDLLLTHGYFLSEDPKELRIMKPYAPLGILYLSSHLKKKGFNVEIYDSTFGSHQELFGIFRDSPPSAVGVYVNLMTRKNVLEIISEAREAGWMVILGGPEPPAYCDEYLNAGAHLIVQGEGEVTMEEVLTAFREHRSASIRDIPGLIFRAEDGSTVHTSARNLIADLDGQPWPDRECIGIEKYIKAWRDHHGMGSLSVITARGCPYHCRWCSHSTYGNTHRRRSAKAVADEVEWLLGRYQPDMLWMADDVFTIHYGWILQYAREMKERRVRVPFECITRADRINPQTADALAELGCFRVWIGSESGSQRILDAMARGVRVGQVEDAIKLCRERGIQTGMFLMWGYEGEEISDIEATIEHVKKTEPDVVLTTVSYPIKGTPYFDQVASRLRGLGDWSETTDRELIIRGRRTGEFYSFADQLLQSEVALHRLSKTAQCDSTIARELGGKIEEARHGLLSLAQRVEQ
ncbi:MAG TPA: radical SAM protein [Acidobacteriota bacterium]|nr:radical SAM protein [Acidobacteriota bacterium]